MSSFYKPHAAYSSCPASCVKKNISESFNTEFKGLNQPALFSDFNSRQFHCFFPSEHRKEFFDFQHYPLACTSSSNLPLFLFLDPTLFPQPCDCPSTVTHQGHVLTAGLS